MGTTDLVIKVMIFAMAGWLASCYRIVHSNMRVTWRRRLIIPLWFAWMAFGFGGPVYAGAMELGEALQTCAGLMAGMLVYLLLHRMNSRARAR